jgi:hypothetical protein
VSANVFDEVEQTHQSAISKPHSLAGSILGLYPT